MAVTLSLLLAGCGDGAQGGASESVGRVAAHHRLVHLRLDANPGAENVAFVMANQLGYFRDAGLSVTLGRPVSWSNAFGYLDGGIADLIVAPEPQVVLAQDGGSPVIAVRSVVQGSTEGLIWLQKSGIDDIADLEGKTIAVSGLGFQEDFLELVLARAGLDRSDVKLRTLPYTSAAALANGRVDAIFGGSWNVEGAELQAKGLKPVFTPLRSFGIPPFEQSVLLADSSRLPSEENFIRLMSALDRGTAAAIAHPAAAARAIAAELSEPEKNAAKWRAKLRATLPLLSRSGQMSPRRANRLGDWMLARGLIEFEAPASELLTNAHLQAASG
jgi:ABC-type nitrate/sulfonate/bicarbonate transport system substrate-binding protein